MANFEEPKIINPTPKQITNFLNKNKMTCGSGKNKKNYMMVAFNEGAYNVLFKKIFRGQYMAKDRTAQIDVNAVSFIGPGKVLDYMDRMAKDPENPLKFRKKIEKLRTEPKGVANRKGSESN
jgi:hypothetical protein